MLFTVTVKNSKIPIDPNEELKLKCTQRISGKQDAAFELLENEILCVKSNKVSQLIASIHSKKGYLCMLKMKHGLCEIKSQREWS